MDVWEQELKTVKEREQKDKTLAKERKKERKTTKLIREGKIQGIWAQMKSE